MDFTADVHRNDDIVTAHNEADGTCTIFEFQEGEIRWSQYKEHRNGDFRSVKGTEQSARTINEAVMKFCGIDLTEAVPENLAEPR